MDNTWIILIAIPAAFVVGVLLGYRVGVIAGYDRAEKMLAEIVLEQYGKMNKGEEI